MRGLVLLAVVASTLQQQSPPPQPQHGAQAPAPYHRRFEYKFSFKPPYLAQKDGSVPFFEYSGNAIASKESVRITPSLKSQKGMIWTRQSTTFDWWDVEVHFRVTGRGRVGADGLAFWYTTTKGMEGPVFGSSDMWHGLGVFFDSFDNDNGHNNPYIMAMSNDGYQAYDHQKDGSSQQMGGCLRDFRNKPFPLRAKITYYNNVLTLSFLNGMSSNERDYELCFRAENVFLPSRGFFGISAATGGLADDHDVLKLLVSSMSPAGAQQPGQDVDDQRSKQIEEEFKEYQKKLKDQKDEWAKQHPDEVKQPDYDDYDNWAGDATDKDLKMIFQGQSAIRELLQTLDARVEQLTLSSPGAGVVTGGTGGGGGGGGGGDIRRDEVNAILANQREIVTAVRDIKNFVADIHGKTGQILNKGTGSAQPVGQAYDVAVSIKEMRDTVNNFRHEFASTSQKLTGKEGGAACPDVSKLACVSTTVLVAVAAVQVVILISYLVFRDGREAKAKKFY